MVESWPHPPAPPDERRLVPQPAFLVRAAGLAGLTLGLTAGAVALLRVSAWLVPFAVVLTGAAFLSAWGTVVQWLGGEKVDDHPWV